MPKALELKRQLGELVQIDDAYLNDERSSGRGAEQ